MTDLDPDDLEALLFRVLDALEEEEIEHLVTGATLRNVYGDSRTTRDLDIVVHPDQADPARLADIFSKKRFDVQGPREGALGRRLVLEGHLAPVDLWLPSDHPLHHDEFERARQVEYRDRTVPMLHPEDYVLRKLVNFYRIRRSPNDVDDAYQVLLYAWDLVDVDELLERAVTHRVREQAEELVATVREDREALEGGEAPGSPS